MDTLVLTAYWITAILYIAGSVWSVLHVRKMNKLAEAPIKRSPKGGHSKPTETNIEISIKETQRKFMENTK